MQEQQPGLLVRGEDTVLHEDAGVPVTWQVTWARLHPLISSSSLHPTEQDGDGCALGEQISPKILSLRSPCPLAPSKGANCVLRNVLPSGCPSATATSKPTPQSFHGELFPARSVSPLPPRQLCSPCCRAPGLTASDSALTFPAKPRKAACVWHTERPSPPGARSQHVPGRRGSGRSWGSAAGPPWQNGIDLPLNGSRKAFLCCRPERSIWSQRTIKPLSRRQQSGAKEMSFPAPSLPWAGLEPESSPQQQLGCCVLLLDLHWEPPTQPRTEAGCPSIAPSPPPVRALLANCCPGSPGILVATAGRELAPVPAPS